MNQNVEREIDIKDLILHILLQWKWMLLAMVIGAVLLGAFSVVKNKKAIESQKAAISVEQISEECTVEQVEAAELAYTVYLKQELLVNDLKDYINESIIMNIDPSETCVIKDVYLSTSSAGEEPFEINNLNRVFENILYSDAVTEEIKTALECDAEGRFIHEMYWINESEDYELTKEYGGSVFVVTIMAGTADDAQKISEITRKSIGESNVDKMGMDAVAFINSSMETGYDFLLAKTQMENLNKYSEAKTKLDTVVNKHSDLTGKAAELFDALVKTEVTEDKGSESYSIGTLLSKKYILLGAVVGIILVAGIYAFIYILSGTLKKAEELSDYFGLRVIDTVWTEKKMDVLSKKLVKVFNKVNDSDKYSAKREYILSVVKLLSERQNCKKLYITSSDGSKDLQMIMQDLGSEIEKYGMEAVSGLEVYKNADEVKKCMNSDAVILVEKTGTSMIDNIQAEMKTLDMSNKAVLGCVVVG